MRRSPASVLACFLACLAWAAGCRAPVSSPVQEEAGVPVPVCYLLTGSRTGANQGTTFLVDGSWMSEQNYRDPDQTRDIVGKIKEAGIRVVGVVLSDMQGADTHTEIENIAAACRESELEYFIFLRNPEQKTLMALNAEAGTIWERYAQQKPYRRYGFGDDRPLLAVSLSGSSFRRMWEAAPEEEKSALERFRIGTCRMDVETAMTRSDGWGYRNVSECPDGTVRFCCPNAGVHPSEWSRVNAEEWRRRVKWALHASEYAVFGSYDDTVDATMWGICDVGRSKAAFHRNPETEGIPTIYYSILKEELGRAEASPRSRAGLPGRRSCAGTRSIRRREHPAAASCGAMPSPFRDQRSRINSRPGSVAE